GEILVDRGKKVLPLKRIAIADKNCERYGDREWMHSFYGLDVNSITKTILEWGKIRNCFRRKEWER
ncbi:unnamed protein product, partial [marine sediment metagenome]